MGGMKGISVPGVAGTDRAQGDGGQHGFHDGQQHQHLHRCRGATGLGLGTRRDTGAVAIPRHEVPHRQGNAQGEPRGAARGQEITLMYHYYSQGRMKKIMLMAALMAAMTQAHAQRVVEETDLKETEETARTN